MYAASTSCQGSPSHRWFRNNAAQHTENPHCSPSHRWFRK
ncbi:hypothetical protein ENHAE0001_0661 [Enhydrobacter aerosaccus SK60]|nr:hypothetical protein ENHAE0001_0661 [Enhydrobacter aerosaccus SK60]